MRVLHVFGRLDRGGAELRTLDVIRATVDEPVHHEFICLSGLPGALDDDFRAAGAVIHYLPLSLRFPCGLARLLRARRITILHSHVHFFSGGLVMLAAMVGVPTRIVHFRSTHDGQPDTPLRELSRSGQRFLIRRFATEILAVNTGAMDAWSKDWRADVRCRVVLNGLNTGEFASAIHDPLTRIELGVAGDGAIVAFIGRFDPIKRPELALRAFALTGSHPWLVCAGAVTPSHRASFLSLADELGVDDRVVLLGLRDDVARVVAVADVVIMTSGIEGLPGVVLEALAGGCRVVAARLPGTVEIAEHLDGVTLVEPDAPPEVWAGNLDAVLQDVAKTSGDPSIRSKRHEAFCRSPFTVARAAEALTGIWSGNTLRAATSNGSTPS